MRVCMFVVVVVVVFMVVFIGTGNSGSLPLLQGTILGIGLLGIVFVC